MKSKLLILFVWLAKVCGWHEPKPQKYEIKLDIPDDIKTILHIIKTYIEDMDLSSAEGTSGEYKRHVVYSRLIKEYPAMRHSRIALAIEIVIARIKGEKWL